MPRPHKYQDGARSVIITASVSASVARKLNEIQQSGGNISTEVNDTLAEKFGLDKAFSNKKAEPDDPSNSGL